MTTTFRKMIFALALILPGLGAVAQSLEKQLEGKRNLADIMQTVKTWYASPQGHSLINEEQRLRDLKHWNRWAYFMSSRLDEKGNLVNITQKLTEATGLNRPAAPAGGGMALQSSGGTWVPVGPTITTSGIGRVDRLTFHPTNANTLWAGAACGGLWRTTDAGANWTNLTPNISVQAISGIAVNPNNTNSIYILTGDGDSNTGGLVEDFGYMRNSIGVLRSTNGGSTWTKTGDFPGANYSTLVGYRLIMHPDNPDLLYACTSQGIFGTLNGGNTWSLYLGGIRCYNMKFKPGSNNICYAVGRRIDNNRASFWRSTTSGLLGQWDSTTLINNQFNNPTSRLELAVAASATNLVYVLCGGIVGNGVFKGLYLSTDNGVSFNPQTTTPNILGRAVDGSDNAQQSNYDLAIAVSNTSGATVMTGGVRCWRGFNFGVTNNWAYRGGHHEDVHDLGYHPVDNTLWMANDGGVYSSTDNGANWTTHFNDMNVSQFYRMAVNPGDYLNMIAGAQDNGIKRRTGNTATFDHVRSRDGFTVAYDAIDNNKMYSVNNSNVERSIDGGNNWSAINPVNTAYFGMSMAASTSIGNTLFIAADSFWRTSNNGTIWNFVRVNGGWFLRTCPSNGSRIYMAGGTAYNDVSAGILRRSDDAGVTWPAANILSNKPGFPGTFPKITSINVDPTNSRRVWVTFGGFTAGTKVYYSADSGANWVNRSGTLPNVPMNCIALDENNNAYLGTDNGIYYRSTGMSDWVPFYNGLPYVPVTDIVISEKENRIRASTFGRGIWSSDLYSSCVANLALNGTYAGRDFHEASNSITSAGIIQLSEGSKVQMKGGTEVRLMPGFTAQETTQYRAAIGPCGTNGGVGLFDAGGNTTADMLEKAPVGLRNMALVHVLRQGKQPILHITSKLAGSIGFSLRDEDGLELQSWPAQSRAAGEFQETLTMSSAVSAKQGLYFIHVLYNGISQHVQELQLN